MKITIEVTTAEILEIVNNPAKEIERRVFNDFKNELFYSDGKKISIGDWIEILPSENCVTNTDTIKYDELIDGKRGLVYCINISKNIVTIKLTNDLSQSMVKADVHPTWLKCLSKFN